ncbi:hypothetical protein [Proteiniclasticum sp.]|uniref:hypothetical protein n=1 Tax=Proteiniclasticum sp. TaxID=2053595 RepID=UPI0028A28801|nr:hypothetical protein [Proteiniclasticum sp.]
MKKMDEASQQWEAFFIGSQVHPPSAIMRENTEKGGDVLENQYRNEQHPDQAQRV